MADTEKVTYFSAEQFQQIAQTEAVAAPRAVYQFLCTVYVWMIVGLMVSFLAGFLLSTNQDFIAYMQDKQYIPFAMFMFHFGVNNAYQRIRNHLNAWTATAVFIVYALLTGFTFATAFMSCNVENLLCVFCITSLMFVLLVLASFLLKRDLPIPCQFGLMGGSGLMLLFLLQGALHLEMLQIAISGVCLMFVVNHTVSSSREIKKYIEGGISTDEEDSQKEAIDWALRMYTGYMGMFYTIMRVMGIRRH